jgi:predicted phosphodiesterase
LSFTFVHVTDPHLSTDEGVLGPFVEAINGERFHPRPDFVVLTGDLVQGGKTADELRGQLEIARRCLDRLDGPLYVTAGNHDVLGEANLGETFADVFELDDHYDARSLQAGWTGVFMPMASGPKDHRSTPRDRVDWLRGALDSAGPDRVLLFSHEPMLPPRDLVPPEATDDLTGPPWPSSIDPQRWQAHYFGMAWEAGAKLRDTLARSPARVVAHYSGHAHVHARREVAGVQHIVTGALCSAPWEYRHVAVHADRLEHRCFSPVPPPMRKHPAFYPGCVDGQHATVDAYHRGNPDEREFVVKLRP